MQSTLRQRVLFMPLVAIAAVLAIGSAPSLGADARVTGYPATRRELSLQLRSGDPVARAGALLGFMELNLRAGLFPEAYAYAVQASVDAPALLESPVGHAAAKMAFVLAQLPDEADRAQVSVRPFADPKEDLFWRLAAAALARQPLPGDIATASRTQDAFGVIRGYPKMVQAALLPPLADGLLAAGNASMARKLIEMADAEALNAVSPACKAWISGRIAEIEGYPKTALARFAEAGDIQSRCAAQARLRWIERMLDDAKTKGAGAKALERLLAEWTGDDVEAAALSRAARLAEERNTPIAALGYIGKLAVRYPERLAASMDLRAAAERLASDVLSNGLETRSPEDIERDRARYAAFIGAPDLKRRADLAFGERLLKAGRAKDCAALLSPLWATRSDAKPGDVAAVGLTLAAAHLRASSPSEAVAVLVALPGGDEPGLWTDARRNLVVEAFVASGRAAEIDPRIMASLSSDDRMVLAGVRLREEDWAGAFTLLKDGFTDAPADVSPAFRETFVAAAILAHREAEAQTMLAGEGPGAASETALAALLSAPAVPALPVDVVRGVLNEAGSMIAAAGGLARE